MVPFMPPPPSWARARVPRRGQHHAEVDRSRGRRESTGAIAPSTRQYPGAVVGSWRQPERDAPRLTLETPTPIAPTACRRRASPAVQSASVIVTSGPRLSPLLLAATADGAEALAPLAGNETDASDGKRSEEQEGMRSH